MLVAIGRNRLPKASLLCCRAQVAEKFVTADPDGAPESPASEGWAGVMPGCRTSLQEEAVGSAR